jgi:hypothetical protein
MLFGSVARDHPHNSVVTPCEGHVLVGEVVGGLNKRCGDYVLGPTTEHEPKEALGRLIKVSGKRQTIMFCWIRCAEVHRI